MVLTSLRLILVRRDHEKRLLLRKKNTQAIYISLRNMSLQDFKLEKDVYLCSVWKLTGEWREDRKPQLEPGNAPTEEWPGPGGQWEDAQVHDLTSLLRTSPWGSDSESEKDWGMQRVLWVGEWTPVRRRPSRIRAKGGIGCWIKQPCRSGLGAAPPRAPPPILNCPPHLALGPGHWTGARPANLLSQGLGPDTEDSASRPGGQGWGS